MNINKTISALLAISLCLTGCAKSSSVKDWDEPVYLSFNDILKEANKNRFIDNDIDEESEELLASFKSADEIRTLTEDEIHCLTAPIDKRNVTKAEALEDVDIFFRLLRYAYAPYDYFGEENFIEAEQKVIASIDSALIVDNFIDILYDSLSFVKDAHFQIEGKNFAHAKGLTYKYRYDINQQFSKDEKGFYKSFNGVKYYVDHFSDEQVTIEPTLLEDGHIAYVATLFTPGSYTIATTKLYLKSQNEEIVENVTFKNSSNYASESYHTSDASTKVINNVGYVTVRAFEDYEATVLNSEYINKASLLKDCDFIIYDVRSNGGGSSDYSKNWTYNYSGIEPSFTQFFVSNENALSRNKKYGEEEVIASIIYPTYIENDVPIIMLIDAKSGSSGEVVIQNTNVMDNVIVIGTNSAGYRLSGNAVNCYLPNSGINVYLPTIFNLEKSFENNDGKGYKPDIWCEGDISYETILKMMEINGPIEIGTTTQSLNENKKTGITTVTIGETNKTDFEQLENFEDNHQQESNEEIINTEGLLIVGQNIMTSAGNGFGPVYSASLDVYFNGELIRDYKVSTNEEKLNIYNESGKLCIECQNNGEFPFKITYDNETYDFRLVN